MTRTIASWASVPRRTEVAPSLAAGRVAFATTSGLVVTEAGRPARTFAANAAIDRVELSADGGSMLAVLDGGSRVQVWQVTDGSRTVDLVRQKGQKQIRAGFFSQGADPVLFATSVASDGAVCIDPRTGKQRTWVSVDAMIVFVPQRVVSLDETTTALIGYHHAEQYDSLAIIPSAALTSDHGVIQSVFTGRLGYHESAKYVAIGPCGAGKAVVWRTALVEPDEDTSADAYECFTGLAVMDLAGKVVQRVAHAGPVSSGTQVGGNDRAIAILHPDGVELIERAAGRRTRVDAANALDPVRMVAARVSASGQIELLDVS